MSQSPALTRPYTWLDGFDFKYARDVDMLTNVKPSGIDQTSAFSSVTEREAGYAYIQREILTLEEAARSWKQRHNELSLIYRLPREVLSAVFKEVTTFSTEPRFVWLRVTHVCHHWRQVALGDPNLWNHITLEQPELVQAMLDRSKMAPLVVEAVVEGPFQGKRFTQATAALELALKQLQRIKDLTLLFETPSSYHVSLEFLGHPAPLLETCSIRLDLRSNARLPIPLFSCTCPRLTSLSIAGCIVDWKSSSLGTLRTLEMRYYQSGPQPSARDIFSTISNMPFLESLIYCGGCKASTEGPALTADLPQLRNLEIESDLAACVFLSNGIIHANTPRMKFRCKDLSLYGGAADSTPIRVLATNLGNKLPKPITCLDIRHCQVIAKTSDDKVIRDPQFGSLDISLSAGDFFSRIFKHLLQPLPLRDLYFLTVKDASISISDWATVFGDLIHLTKIDFSDGVKHSDMFVKALSIGYTSTTPNTSTAKKFRALKELVIREWDFYNIVSGDATIVQRLTKCLRMRKTSGNLLEKLTLKECEHIDEGEIEKLEKIGIQVNWDGEEDTESDSEEEEEDSESNSEDYDD